MEGFREGTAVDAAAMDTSYHRVSGGQCLLWTGQEGEGHVSSRQLMETRVTRIGVLMAGDGCEWGQRGTVIAEISAQFCQETKVALKIKFTHKAAPGCVSHAALTEGVEIRLFSCLSGPLDTFYCFSWLFPHTQEDPVVH